MFFKTPEEGFELWDRQKDGTEPLLSSMPTHRTFDYVLVAHKEDDDTHQKAQRQRAFIEQLEKKSITVTRIVHDDKVFFGLRAPSEMFEDYQYLLKVSDSCNWCGDVSRAVTQATRIRIVHFILHQTFINTGENLKELLMKDVFETIFCLHERKKQQQLKREWARWSGLFTGQPVNDIKCYFGEKVALYYLWLGWYTKLLVPAAALGVVVFLYGLAFFNTNPLIKEVCNSSIIMCPRCDNRCKVWQLSDTCGYAKVSHLFDNDGTVAFAMFMAIWATLFLELWKRHRARHVSQWNVHDWCEDEVNRWISLKLCDMEKTNSFAATERSFTVKMFTFQFFTLFSSLFYVAFFLGRINGHPGNYVRIARWRLEECHPSGCLTDLFIQMAVIMLLKQILNNIFEFTVPWLKSCLSRNTAKKLERKCGQCYRKACHDVQGSVEPCDICKLRDWLRNYHLANTDAFGLFNEFLEMALQFSFTTIFVAAFPLAPLLALINNIFEIRLDAIKMVRLERRLVPRKTNDIGVWTKVLEAIGVLAVIANGLVIGVTSDFIPRLVYHYHYGPCANGSSHTHCMQGYINDTLSTAFLSHFAVRKDFVDTQMRTDIGFNVTQCSYRDYRSDEDYTLTSQFWLVLAVRFAFVILFEHVVVVCKFVAAWFVPNSPMQVKNDRLHDKLARLKEEIRELKRRRSTDV
ncbi:anoctamin-9-like isoform X3 [Hippoglossus hippoglossus]|uniref:anoctamin-9-like isoform X3 n=1 Tax=Hippoglossus hippoglossus TaxID=8267 RepID=UPI00148E1EB7|nr:anoctamin-9-like isoform X3 [Hippoglossus hippoglossus]